MKIKCRFKLLDDYIWNEVLHVEDEYALILSVKTDKSNKYKLSKIENIYANHFQ